MNAKLALLLLAALVAVVSASHGYSSYHGYRSYAGPYYGGYRSAYHGNGYGVCSYGHHGYRHRRSLGHSAYHSYHPRGYRYASHGYGYAPRSYGYGYAARSYGYAPPPPCLWIPL
ncbi:keratin-associated protein 6-1-like [Pollicipes pollicipes]|uniref:keratin-associated protein 6-1-like n=1 Tax=Pollicipes pollicipes TaxID=41117 RepID=UPI0018856A2F|nr:keratin-associated protein 6-1-like [Pollicipes pollicipes]